MSDLTVADELALSALPEETRALINRLVAASLELETDKHYREYYEDGFEDGRTAEQAAYRRAAEKRAARESVAPVDNSTLTIDESPKRPGEHFVVHPPKKRLIKNMARCIRCDTTLESKYAYDLKACACGNFVDGGLWYLRRGGDPDEIEELSEWVDA